MIRSTNRDLGEFDLIKQPAHVERVWQAVEQRLPSYWEKFLAPHRGADPVEQLSAKFGKGGGGGAKGEAQAIAAAFRKAIDDFHRGMAPYREFFDLETLEEFLDDPLSFKQSLSQDVPVIARTLQGRRPELKDWQRYYRAARARDLLHVFTNVISFIETDWSPQNPAADYEKKDSPEAFGLDPLDSDETMNMPNVVGMGIKSIILYYRDPERLPHRGYDGLYGLYFLSGMDNFGLPSGSSEFLMINDEQVASNGSMIMDQNYWYPYGLFSLYSLRLYRWIETQTARTGYTLDRKLRFVFTEAFLSSVCGQHGEDLATMRAHDRFGVIG